MRKVTLLNESGDSVDFEVATNLSEREALIEAWAQYRELPYRDDEYPPAWALKPSVEIPADDGLKVSIDLGVLKPQLNADERDLLLWLSREDFSQYGECHGKALDKLVELGLAQVHQPGEHQNFIANDFAGTKGDMYRAVSLTEAGVTRAEELRDGR